MGGGLVGAIGLARARPANDALASARTFVYGAVMRRDLAGAWSVTAPSLRGSHAQWMTGTIRVVPFWDGPVSYHLRQDGGDRRLYLVDMGGTPFWMRMRRTGAGWRIAYWAPATVFGAPSSHT